MLARSLIDGVCRKTTVKVGIEALRDVLGNPTLKARDSVDDMTVEDLIALLKDGKYLPDEGGQVKASGSSRRKSAPQPTASAPGYNAGYEPGDSRAAIEPSTRKGLQFELQSSRPRWTKQDEEIFNEIRGLRQRKDEFVAKHPHGKPYRVKPREVIPTARSDGDHFQRGELKYADPLVQDSWIYIDPRVHQAYMIDKTRSYLKVSGGFKRLVRDRFLRLSLVRNLTCIDCGEELMNKVQLEEWTFNQAMQYLSHKLRLPGDRRRGDLFEPPSSHPDCAHQVAAHTEIVAAYAEAVEKSGDDNGKMSKALATLQKRAEHAAMAAYAACKPSNPELDKESVQRRARVMLNRLGKKMEEADAIPR